MELKVALRGLYLEVEAGRYIGPGSVAAYHTGLSAPPVPDWRWENSRDSGSNPDQGAMIHWIH